MRGCVERAESPAQRRCHPRAPRNAVLVSDRPRCHVPPNSAKRAHGSRHVTGRCDKKPALARRWTNALPGFQGILVSVARYALELEALRIQPERGGRARKYIAVRTTEE